MPIFKGIVRSARIFEIGTDGNYLVGTSAPQPQVPPKQTSAAQSVSLARISIVLSPTHLTVDRNVIVPALPPAAEERSTSCQGNWARPRPSNKFGVLHSHSVPTKNGTGGSACSGDHFPVILKKCSLGHGKDDACDVSYKTFFFNLERFVIFCVARFLKSVSVVNVTWS